MKEASGSSKTSGIMLAERGALVRSIPRIFDELSETDRDRLLAIGRRLSFEEGTPIFSQGEEHVGIHLIETGRVHSYYKAPSGRAVTLAYWLPGNFVGAPAMFGGGAHMWESVAVQKTTTIFLEGAALRTLATGSAAIALALLDALAFKARCYSTMAQMLGTRSAAERLKHLLRFLATTYGLKEPDGTVIAAVFTQAELANLIGSTRQWVTVQLARLQERGIIRYDRGGLLVIRDLDALDR
jgi:CRP/FNR family cyclic AMP-dependent transcriptional regulator